MPSNRLRSGLVLAAALISGCIDTSTPGTRRDGGGGDGRADEAGARADAQRDASSQQDGVLQQDAPSDGPQDAPSGGQQDAWPAGCNATGGQSAGGLCSVAGDCRCPFGCENPWNDDPSAPVKGSCWPTCFTSANCAVSELCERINSTTEVNGHCFPKGTFTFSFQNLPLYNSGYEGNWGGTVTASISVGDISVPAGAMTTGTVVHYTNPNMYIIYTMQVGGTVNRQFSITVADSSWNTTPQDIALSSTISGKYFEHLNSPATDTLKALVQGGTLQLTKAPTTAGQTVSGSVTSGVLFKFVQEYCGPNTHSC
jgi:hypothetical protein